jgi:hypothetical protein
MHGLIEFAIVEEIFKAFAERYQPKPLPKLVSVTRLLVKRPQAQVIDQEDDASLRDAESGQVTLTQC